jgi:hypothetical protein
MQFKVTNMFKEKFARRFVELDERIPFTNPVQWQQWATSVQNLILAVFGAESPHYRNYSSVYERCCKSNGVYGELKEIFASAKEDFEGGYVFDVELRVSGEVFGDFVVLAQTALREGYKDVAAVLACAALEDALKRYAMVNGIDINDKTMQQVVSALRSGGLVSGAQKTLLDAMPRIRNLAMHADWAKISEPDVNSVIGFVEQFLLTKFTGE